MMKKRALLILSFISLLFGRGVFAQVIFQKVYSGAALSPAFTYSAVPTADSGYFFAGRYFNSATSDGCITKTNANGVIEWTESIGDLRAENIFAARQTADGRYITAGTSRSFSPDSLNEFYILRLSAAGNVDWEKIYGSLSGAYEVGAHCINQTSDGGFIIGGYEDALMGMLYLKTDSSGTPSWGKFVSGSIGTYGVESILETTDGGYIITGNGGTLIKTDSSGAITWSKSYISGAMSYAAQQTSDGGYMLAGETSAYGSGGYDMYLIKTDSAGDVEWCRTFGGASDEYLHSARQTSDGGYILAGYTYSFSSSTDVYVVKTDGSGNLVWSKIFGGGGDDWAFSVGETSGGGFVIAGQTNSFTSGINSAYLIKTDASGVSGCNEATPPTLVTSPVIVATALGDTATTYIPDTYVPSSGVGTGLSEGLLCLSFPAACSASADVMSEVSCNGQCNGLAVAIPSGGTPPYAYAWTPSGGSNQTALNLCAGTYTCSVTDSLGCITSTTVAITEPALLTATVQVINNVLCNGQANGSAMVTVSGGTGTYTYSWSPIVSTSATATNLAAGLYTAMVTDGNGCTASTTVSITEPDVLLDNTSVLNNVSCNGGSDGAASITLSGGTLPFTYSWSPGGCNMETCNNLSEGIYNITVIDSNGCTAIDTVSISEPPPLTANAQMINNVLCNGQANGTAAVTASGGTGAYTYSWSPVVRTSATATNLAAGLYTAMVTDGNGCTASTIVSITEPPLLTVSAQTLQNVSCNGGNDASVTVTVNGGTGVYTYSWSPIVSTSATATNLSFGLYTAMVTEGNGCTASTIVSITEPPLLTAAAQVINNVLCSGQANGSAMVTVNGGAGVYTYSWSPIVSTSATATNLAAGLYTAIVTDGNDCTVSSIVSITEPDLPIDNTSVLNNVSCYGGSDGSAEITLTGGTPPFAYSWSPGGCNTQVCNSLSAGTYFITVTDSNGCIIIDTVNITEPPLLTSNAPLINNISCYGACNGSAGISSFGGTPPFSYQWSPSGGNAQTATGLCAGTYTVTVTDANACAITSTVVVTQPPVLTANAQVINNATCNGGGDGSAYVIASGGTGAYTYSWLPIISTSATATGLAVGLYTAMVTDGNGCTSSSIVSIIEPGAPLANTSALNNVSCNGGSDGSAEITLTGGTPPFTYLWSPGSCNTQTCSSLSAGFYNITATDSNGCTVIDTVSITEPPVLTANAPLINNVSCYGACDGSIDISPFGGTQPFTYQWSPSGGNAQTATGLCAGAYTATVTDANACSVIVTVVVTQPQVLTANSQVINNVSCNGFSNGSATVNVNGGTSPYSYQWMPVGGSAVTANNLSAGCYTVTVTDGNTCATFSTVCITESPALTANAQTLQNISCYGGGEGARGVTVTGGTPPYSYLWSPGSCPSATCSNQFAGCYTATVSDAYGCTITSTTCITQPPPLTIYAPINSIPCPPDPICVSAFVLGGISPYTYTWLPTGGNSIGMCTTVAGIYTISVTDANGCTAFSTVTIPTPPSPLSVSLTVTEASCSTCCDGSISVDSVFGGVGGYTYNWSPVSSTADSISALCADIYTVTVTDLNGCTVISIDTVSYPTSVAAISTGGNGITIHPNPFTNELRITWNKGTGSRKDLSLFDITGKEILRRETSEEEIILNTENLAAGFYLLRAGGKNYKVVKEE
jgi:hypothetical protein